MSTDMSGWTAHPHRLAVDAEGYVWRWYPAGTLSGVEGDSWSMAPTNPDNSPIPQPVTFYAPTDQRGRPVTPEDQARADQIRASLAKWTGIFPDAILRELSWLLDRLAAATDRADKAEAAVGRVEMRHANLRCALSVLHAWPDGVTGKRMVDAEDILTLLEADRAALFPAEEAPSE